MGVMPWSLLKHGLLSGKFRREAGQKLEKRRALMGDWAQFLAGPKVIRFREVG
jgi:aryl-alcohol dehydrogenase-like predicted oxidoreductase